METEFLTDILLKLKEDELPLKHISDINLALFIDGRLDKKLEDEVISHLAICKRCRDILANIASSEEYPT